MQALSPLPNDFISLAYSINTFLSALKLISVKKLKLIALSIYVLNFFAALNSLTTISSITFFS
jgi:hypothetical protein